MAVATPLSLNHIFNEFGGGILSTSTFNSGSGVVTPPADAAAARIYVWGGGGGGGNGGEAGTGGRGGGGGFLLKTISSVTPGVTSFSYSVGGAGLGNSGPAPVGGNPGGSSSVAVGGITYAAYGGQGGAALGGNALGGDTSVNGDYFETGGKGLDGGNAGGSGIGGRANFGGGAGGVGSDGFAPGGAGDGGGAGEGKSYDGAAGRVKIEWLSKTLSTYTRGSGAIANHSANLNIPTTTTGLSVSDFSGAEKDFTATIIRVQPSGYSFSGYSTISVAGSYGSITRTQVGRSRATLDYSTILEASEYAIFNWDFFLFDNYYYLIFDANAPLAPFFSQVRIGASPERTLTRISAYNGASGTFDSVNLRHYWYWYLGQTEGSFFITENGPPIKLFYEGV